LLLVLVKNNDENKKKINKVKDPITAHLYGIGADYAELDVTAVRESKAAV
jgi:hypothetical protein